MKHKVRRFLAVLLALSMCMGMLSVTALAVEDGTTITGAGTAEDPTVVVEVTTVPTTSEDGSVTVTVTTKETWEGTTEELVPVGGESDADADADDDAGADSDADADVDVDADEETPVPGTITTVTGSETTIEETVTDGNGYLVKESGSVSGSETTTTETTQVDVTEQKDVVINGDGQGDVVELTPSPVPSAAVDGDAVEENVNPENDGWVEGETETNEDWIQNEAKSEEGKFNTVGGTQPKPAEDPEDVVITEPNSTITLEMTTGEKTDTETVYVGLGDTDYDVDAILALKDEGSDFEDENGKGTKTVTVTPQYAADNETIVGYTVTTTKTYDEKLVSENVEGDTYESGRSEIQTTQTAPEGYEAGEKSDPIYQTDDDGNPVLDENGDKIETGNVTVTTTPIYQTDDEGNEVLDGDGNPIIIGYTITKTTTTYGSEEETNETDAKTTTEKAEPDVDFKLPEEPQGGESIDENGNLVTVTVENIYENGEHVGYKSITVVTDGNGKVLSRASDSVYGTTITVNKTTVTDPTKEVVTTDTTTVTTEVTTVYGTTYTQEVYLSTDRTDTYETTKVTDVDNYQLVEINGELYYIYTGTMGEVTDNSSMKASATGTMANSSQYNGDNWKTTDDDIQNSSDTNNGSWNSRIGGTNAFTTEQVAALIVKLKETMKAADMETDRIATTEQITGLETAGKLSGYTTDEIAALKEIAGLRDNMEDGEYVLMGYGLISEYNIDDDQADGDHCPKQYAIMDNTGNILYGYCVELDKGLKWEGADDSFYTSQDLGSYETFYNSEDKVAQISVVANNGFWGTYEVKNGVEQPITGSLAYVKQLLTNNKDLAGLNNTELQAVLNSLTAGQAMTATQAAIWKYGTNNPNATLGSIQDLKQYYYNNETGEVQTLDTSSQDYKNINALFKVLTGLADAENVEAPPELIDGSDLTGATIILNGKVTDKSGDVLTEAEKNENGEIVLDAEGQAIQHEKYNADLKFTLAVSTSSITGELQVHVIQNGVTIRTEYLSKENGNIGTLTPDKNGTYTISNLQIAEGINITLNLVGTQHLANGVYVYECGTSQNFVGLSTVSQNVDIAVDLEFNVTAPDANVQHSGTTKTEMKTDKEVETKTETRKDEKVTTTTETDSSTEESKTITTKVYADLTITEVTVRESESEREWSSAYENIIPTPTPYVSPQITPTPTPTVTPTPTPTPETSVPVTTTPVITPDQESDDDLDILDEDVPLADQPVDSVIDIPEDDVPLADIPDEGVPLAEIPDEEVPLAALPMTGDISALWYALSLLSGGGLLLLRKKNKDEDEE